MAVALHYIYLCLVDMWAASCHMITRLEYQPAGGIPLVVGLLMITHTVMLASRSSLGACS